MPNNTFVLWQSPGGGAVVDEGSGMQQHVEEDKDADNCYLVS